MDPEVLKQLAKGTIPLGIGIAIAFSLLWRGTPKDKPASRLSVAMGVLAVTVGYLLTHHFVFTSITLNPSQAFDTIPLVVGGAGLLFVVGAMFVGGSLAGTIAASLGAAYMSYRVINARMPLGDGPWMELGVFAGLLLASMLAASWYASRSHTLASSILLLGFAGGSSQLLVLSMSSLKHGQVAGAAAAIAGGMVVAALLTRRASLVGVWSLLVLIVGVSMEQGWRYGGGSGNAPIRGVLLASSVLPLAALAHAFLPVTLKGVKRAALEIVIAALPMVVALGTAGYELAKQQGE